MKLPGYGELYRLYESPHTMILRGRRKASGETVVLKILKETAQNGKFRSRLKHEFMMVRSLNLDCVVRARTMLRQMGQLIIEFEDFQGISLKKVLQDQRFSIDTALEWAVKLVTAVGQIHAAGIVHKDINPTNVLVNLDTGQLKLIDLAFATALSSQNPLLHAPHVLEGRLAYLSPEQTGRMDRKVDYRTDFYSLGVILYEMICHRLPFLTEDPLELVHAHIAIMPPAPHQLEPLVPEAVSQIVMKLLAKNSEKRYQSAVGLQWDLEQCLSQIRNHGELTPFNLGSKDRSDRLHMPQKLYGRQASLEILKKAFAELARGEHQMVLVAGPAGIGKSVLVREAYQHAVTQPGPTAQIRLITGKFDQLQQGRPYSAVVSALKELVRQLLCGSDERLKRWCQNLSEALGPSGRIIIDVIPEMALIIGPRPALPPLGPTEAQNRFELVFQNFIRALCQSDHPLAIFLDDLQWADRGSLKLIEQMALDRQLNNLLLIGAYRDGQVGLDHPLTGALNKLTRRGFNFRTVALEALDLASLAQMLADLLNSDRQRVMPLAQLVRRKTGGNPFFAEVFLKSLHARKLVQFDPRKGEWLLDLAKIEQLPLTDGVVSLVTASFEQLDPKIVRLLQLAACIANTFTAEPLAHISRSSPEETALGIQRAISEGLVVPTGRSLKGVTSQEYDEYAFAHNRIQQAAYSMLAPSQQKTIHLQLGRFYLETTSADQLPESIFDIVNHLNLAHECINDAAERAHLAQLNFVAGKKAKAAAAYDAAMLYFETGIGLLGETGWQQSYKETLALHVEATEAAYLCARYQEMTQYSGQVLRYAASLIDRVKVYEIQIDAFKARYRIPEAMQVALHTLRMLGVHLPGKPTPYNIIKELIKTRLRLIGQSIESLADLEPIKDPHKLASMQILMRTSSAAYFSNPLLLPLLASKGIRFSMRYGNSPESAFLSAVFGLILCGALQSVKAGYQFGQVALKIIAQFQDKALRARTLFIVSAFIQHRRVHVKETLAAFAEALRTGQEAGDFEYAGFSGLFYIFSSIMAGRQLHRIEKEIPVYHEAVSRLKQSPPLHMLEIYRQTVANLRGATQNPCHMAGEYYNEAKMVPLHLRANDRTTLCNLHFNKLYLSYLFGNDVQDLSQADLAESYLDGVMGTLVVPLFYTYDSLARIRRFEKAEETEQRLILKKVRANQRKLKRWARHAPMNHQHKYDLVAAEKSRIMGRRAKAAGLYERAIGMAQHHGFLQEAALANELAGIFYLQQDQPDIALTYLQAAHRCYQSWGAISKVEALEEQYSQLLMAQPRSDSVSDTHDGGEPEKPPDSTDSLDLATVLKASQALSGEIIMAELMEQLMRYIIEAAGAQKGFLILAHTDQLLIEASVMTEPHRLAVMQSLPLEDSDDLSLDVVRFVFRSGEDIVIHDAAEDTQFAHDLYLIQNHPKSILCMPIRSKDTPSGVLYLENNLTTYAFTRDRIKVLQILLSQAAISLENARLYQELKQEIAERKQAQDKLYHLVAAIEQAAEGVVVCHRDGSVRYVNPAFERITGYGQAEIIGFNLKLLANQHHDNLFFRKIWRRISSGRVWSGHITTEPKDRDICELEVTISPIWDKAESLIGFVALTRDVTREVQMEKDLRHAQKMEAIGTLAGGIAHDFNNILFAIMGFIELAKESEPADSQPFEDLTEALKACHRAKDLVQQILLFARQGEIKRQPVTITAIVKETLKFLRSSLPSTIQIEQDLQSTGQVLADPTQIQQIIMNICTNAAHAMNDHGGVLGIALKDVILEKSFTDKYPAAAPGEFIHMAIRDTGHGMPAHVAERIFDPYFTTKPPGKGTGMGLATVQGIVQRCMGAITVTSSPEQGTTFDIYLPRCMTAETFQVDEPPRNTHGSEHILFVDDETAITQMAARMLERFGYRVTAESDSRHALEIFRQRPDQFDLVITDLTMPHLTGDQMAQQMIELNPRLPVILCTGYGERISREDVVRRGIRDLALKPLRRDELAMQVRSVLDQSKAPVAPVAAVN
jgi:PAS domain S-box-containing protein